jgi:hypothetical protein
MDVIKCIDHRATLTECFASDKELITKWHIASGKLEDCVERTFKDMADAKIEMFKLIEDNKCVGYFGLEGDSFLSGFFLKPEFRSKKDINNFWNIIDNVFDNKPYYSGVYLKNTRAIKFLSKKGRVVLEVPDKGLVFLLNER